MKIRKASVGDEFGIAQVQFEAWQAAYIGIMPDTFIRSMDRKTYQNNWRKALSQQGKGCYRVAEEHGNVIGFATFGPARDVDLKTTEAAELVALNVLPDYWRKKVGSLLLSEVLASVQGSYQFLYLWVAEQNVQAIEFYRASGFMLEGQTKSQESHGGINEVRYRKAIV